MRLTFNLSDISYLRGFNALAFGEFLKKPVPEYRQAVKKHETEEFIVSGFETSSKEIRQFLDKTFGIDMVYTSTHRNQLNKLIKKIAPTHAKRGTKLNFYQFRDLILLEEFNHFILNNFNPRDVSDVEKMYNEIMFLQQNKFQETLAYKQQKVEDYKSLAYGLNLIDGLAEFLKLRYCEFLILWDLGVFYGDTKMNNKGKEILDIVSYRFRQTNPLIYKFSSVDDVNTTNDEQVIRFFIEDIDAWYNDNVNREI